MGYSSVKHSVFDQSMPQTRRNVAIIIDFAGWSYTEAADLIKVPASVIMDAGIPDNKWRELVGMCGKRAFDYDPE